MITSKIPFSIVSMLKLKVSDQKISIFKFIVSIIFYLVGFTHVMDREDLGMETA